MNQHGRLEVIDRQGWRREHLLQKAIVHIGSDPRNDVVLEPGRGTGVAPLHAQLITSTDRPGYQLVNLGDADILLGLSGDQAIPPRSATNIVSGTVFKVGEFTLVFYGDGGASGGLTTSSEHIGLRVSLPQMWLEPNRSLDGIVTVSNLGDQGGVQFKLELEGLESGCYDIEPGPILASNAEKEVSFHLYHKGDKPLAGDRRITIRATAPRVYPAEQATVSQVIRVLPFFHHKLSIIPPGKVGPSRRVEERRAPVVEAGPPQPTVKRAPKIEASPPSQIKDWWAPTPIVAMERAPQAEAAAPPQVEVAEPTTRAETSLPPQVEEPMPETEARPLSLVAAEPTPQIEAGLPEQVEEGETPEAEIFPPAQMEGERALEVEAGSLSPAEDWWSVEAEADREGETEERQVLKLKASPPSEEAEQEQAEAGPPPAEDWWSAEAEAGLEGQAEEEQVLKLKASPPSEEAEQEQAEAGPSPPTEDWWTPQPETGAPSQSEEEPAQVKADASSRAEEERAPDTEADTR